MDIAHRSFNGQKRTNRRSDAWYHGGTCDYSAMSNVLLGQNCKVPASKSAQIKLMKKRSIFSRSKMERKEEPKPILAHASNLFADLYELTMAFSYFELGRHTEEASFDVFFRKNPFDGHFTVFAGVDRVMAQLEKLKGGFTTAELTILRERLNAPYIDEFISYLRSKAFTSHVEQIKVTSLEEGKVCFPRVPVMTITGPLVVCQLLETVVLNLTGYASLVATNAARMRRVVGPDRVMLEFGARRAQGPDGAESASYYACVGGFDGTSLVSMGHVKEIRISGTMAHSFVTSFTGKTQLNSLPDRVIPRKTDSSKIQELDPKSCISFKLVVSAVEELVDEFFLNRNRNKSELLAFAAYAMSFPDSFLALVDSYDVLQSGVPNYLIVALALAILSYEPRGIRLDSGNLAQLAIDSHDLVKKFNEYVSKMKVSKRLSDILGSRPMPKLGCPVFASNDLDEKKLRELESTSIPKHLGIKNLFVGYGVGTRLVTCKQQPALGMVYKLVETNKVPCMKFSEDKGSIGKQTLPGKKLAFRLLDAKEKAIGDLICLTTDIHNHLMRDKLINLNTGEPESVMWSKMKPLLIPVNKTDLSTKRKLVLSQLSMVEKEKSPFVNLDAEYKVFISPLLKKQILDLGGKLK